MCVYMCVWEREMRDERKIDKDKDKDRYLDQNKRRQRQQQQQRPKQQQTHTTTKKKGGEASTYSHCIPRRPYPPHTRSGYRKSRGEGSNTSTRDLFKHSEDGEFGRV